MAANTAHLNLQFTAHDVADEHLSAVEPEGEKWAISIYGADHPGIVAAMAKELAGVRANIVDLSTRLVQTAEVPVYAMLIDAIIPPDVGSAELLQRLNGVAGSLGVTCNARRSDADTF